jgi:hypothetical protein
MKLSLLSEDSNDDIEDMAKKAGVDIDGLSRHQIKMGMEVEKEHDGEMGKDVDIISSKGAILKTAVAHLRERGDYYTMLSKAESE